MSSLPDWVQTLAVRYDNPVRFVFYGDPRVASQYIKIARSFHGGLRNSLSLGSINQGHRMRVLADGTVIRCLWDGATDIIEIITSEYASTATEPKQYIPKFLFYEKGFYTDPFMFGYWYDGQDESSSGEPSKKRRTLPYIPGEPEAFIPLNVNPEYNSITELNYDQETLAYKIVEGKNPGFGNQRVFVKAKTANEQPSVYSWWGHPYGDLPIQKLKVIDLLVDSNQRYMPALINGVKDIYVMLSENVDFIISPPLKIYRNDKVFFSFPESLVALHMIAGVGVRDNGDLLIFLVSFQIATLYYLKAGEDTAVDTGFRLFCEEGMLHPFRFNDQSSKAATIAVLPVEGEDNKFTLNVVSIEITYNKHDGSYSAAISEKIPYVGKKNNYESGENSYYNTSELFIDTKTGERRTGYDAEWPIALYWDREDELHIATIHKTTSSNTYYESRNRQANINETRDHLTNSGVYTYLSESYNLIQNSSGTIKEASSPIKTIIKLDDVEYVIEDVGRTYYYQDIDEIEYPSTAQYTSLNPIFPPYETGADYPPSIDWTFVDKADYLFTNDSRDTDTITGYDAQLLYFSAKDKSLFFIKTVYDISKIRSGFLSDHQVNEFTQYMNCFNCDAPYEQSTSSRVIQWDSIMNFVEQQDDNSTANFIAVVYPNKEIPVGDPVELKKRSKHGANNSSSSASAFSEDGTTSGSDFTNYSNYVASYPSFSQPTWSSSIGPVIGSSPKGAKHLKNSETTEYLTSSETRSLCRKYFHGSNSFTSDASQEVANSIKNNLNKNDKINDWIYCANAAGYFLDPTFTYDAYIYDYLGGIFTNVSSFSFGEIGFGVPECTTYPIGWSIDTPLTSQDS